MGDKKVFKKIYQDLPAGRRRQIYRVLMDKGPLTQPEIEKALGLKRTQVGPPLSRLRGGGLVGFGEDRQCTVTGSAKATYRLVVPPVKPVKKTLPVKKTHKAQPFTRGSSPAGTVSKALSAKYKGAAFLHYVLHGLTIRNIAVTVPMPDVGDDMWFELDGLHRLQVKAIHNVQPLGGVRRYLTNVSGDMFADSADIALAVGLYQKDTGYVDGQYRVGFLSSALMRSLASKGVLSVTCHKGQKDRYNLYFELHPYPRSDLVTIAGSSVKNTSDVSLNFGSDIGLCPDPGLLVQGVPL